jgi:streptogramin lyase
MSIRVSIFLAFAWAICLPLTELSAIQGDTDSYSWKYYRPSNTGLQGDYCEALRIGANGNPWIAGYDPSFEEGGFSRFNSARNRWTNYSNVDYPAIGHPELQGVVRISDFAEDGFGNLWMATGRGGLFYSPSQGPASFERFGEDNSPIRGGWNRGVEVAPDGTVWFSAYATVWGTSGISRFDPVTRQWETHDNPFGDGQIAVQPRGFGHYYTWINITGLDVGRYDSVTDTWEQLPVVTDGPATIIGKNVTDPEGNTWMFRWTDASLFQMQLDRLRPDGTWAGISEPPFGTDVAALRAKSPNLVLVVDGNGGVWRFDGTSWSSLGRWATTSFSSDVDQDANGNVWACGVGGAGRRDAATGAWQRYRITNTSQYDFFNNDLALDKDGNVIACANAGPGAGGMVTFDGVRWTGYNQLTYGLGFDWPFPSDNSFRVHVRKSGQFFVNPMYGGLHRLYQNTWTNMNVGSETVQDMRDDGLGRFWVTYPGKLLLRRGSGWQTVSNTGGTKISVDPTRPGTVWVMGMTDIQSTDSQITRTWTIEDFPELNPQSDQFKGVVVGYDGKVWIGANTVNLPDQSAMIKLDPVTGQYEAYFYGQWLFPGQYVRPLAATPDGRIWFQYDSDFGIDDQGLGYIQGNTIKKFPAPFEGQFRWGGLPHAQIYDLEVRPMGAGYQLWISCASRGIAVLTVKKSTN